MSHNIGLPSIGETEYGVGDYGEEDPATFLPVKHDERAQRMRREEGGRIRVEYTSNISQLPAWNGSG